MDVVGDVVGELLGGLAGCVGSVFDWRRGKHAKDSRGQHDATTGAPLDGMVTLSLLEEGGWRRDGDEVANVVDQRGAEASSPVVAGAVDRDVRGHDVVANGDGLNRGL